MSLNEFGYPLLSFETSASGHEANTAGSPHSIHTFMEEISGGQLNRDNDCNTEQVRHLIDEDLIACGCILRAQSDDNFDNCSGALEEIFLIHGAVIIVDQPFFT